MSWQRVLAEGGVIVGSILLAFALDAWWEDRQQADELRDQLAVVADEMQSARDALQMALNAHAWNAELAAALRAELARVEPGARATVPDTLLGPLFPQTTADVTTGSLEAFIAAGGLELVPDPVVRRDLLTWRTRVEDLQDDEIHLRNFAAADLAAYLRANAAVANAESWSTRLVLSHFGVAPEVAPEKLGTVELRRDQELVNLLAARESGERGMRDSLLRMRAQAERIITAMLASQ